MVRYRRGTQVQYRRDNPNNTRQGRAFEYKGMHGISPINTPIKHIYRYTYISVRVYIYALKPSPGVYFWSYPVFEAVGYGEIQRDTARYS